MSRLPLLVCVLLAACTPQSQPSPAAVEALRLPTAQDLVPAAQTSAQQLLVSPEVAERWARGFARESYAVPGATVCLRLPRRDAAGALISYQHILSSRTDCGGLDRLLALAAAAWPGRADLEAAMLASGAEFVTVEVAAFSYRHPLNEAFRGLPPWLLHLSQRWPEELPRSCVPIGLLPDDPARAQLEVVSHDCGGARRVYDHRLGRLLAPDALLARHDPGAGLRRFQSVLRARHGDRLAARLDEHARLWTRHLEGGAR
jgi:hypothetical protein